MHPISIIDTLSFTPHITVQVLEKVLFLFHTFLEKYSQYVAVTSLRSRLSLSIILDQFSFQLFN